MKKEDIKNFYNANVLKYTQSDNGVILLNEKLDSFISCIPKDGVVLDVGSGAGQDVEYLTEKGFDAIGIDFSSEMIKYSIKNREKGVFINLDFFQVKEHFSKQHFDGIWASSIITHIEKGKIHKFFDESYELLSENGVLALSVRKDEFKNKEILFNNFSKKEIRSLVTENRFEIIEFDEFSLGKSIWFFIIAKKQESKNN